MTDLFLIYIFSETVYAQLNFTPVIGCLYKTLQKQNPGFHFMETGIIIKTIKLIL